MKTILAIFLTVLLLLPVPAVGEIQTITHTVKQPFGGSQSPDDARISAVAKAKREALEMAGTYIESLTVVKNYQVDKDEILALSAGVLKAEVVSQENYHTKDAFGIDIVVKVVVDTSVLEERVKKLLQDRTHLNQLNQARLREKALLEKIAVLEVENRKIGKSKQKSVNLKTEFQAASRGLTAIDWFDKALALSDDEGQNFSDRKKAIEFLNNSIKLHSDNTFAYNNRGVAYHKLGQYQRSIQDYDTAIRLKPDYATAYNNRGAAYGKLGQYQRSIQDCDTAIRLEPDYESPYVNRGHAYHELGQYQRSIQDYDTAIQLNPEDAKAYNNRGGAYRKLGQYQRAIQDYDKAIQLQPDYVMFYVNRGYAYSQLELHQRAIQDFDTAIQLDPDDAVVYRLRGHSYVALSLYQQAIKDYDKSIRLKPDHAEAYDFRGYTYSQLEMHPRAIQDFDATIRLKPKNALAYNNRGLSYILSGNKREGCRSLIKACKLGNCTGYEASKQRGDCQ